MFAPRQIGLTTADDPLDKVMLGLGVVASVSSVGVSLGYGWPIGLGLGLLGFIAYGKAPARNFVTAEAVAQGIDLAGKVAIVTGPTSGIGTETARVLALRGAHVVLAARSEAKLAATKTELEEKLAKIGVKAKLTAIKTGTRWGLGRSQFGPGLCGEQRLIAPRHHLIAPRHRLRWGLGRSQFGQGLCGEMCGTTTPSPSPYKQCRDHGPPRAASHSPGVQGIEQQVGINHIGQSAMHTPRADEAACAHTQGIVHPEQ